MLPASGVGVGWAAITAVCRLCGLGCEDATRLRSHVSAVHPKASRSLREARFFGCGLCGKGFGSLADVTLHVQSSHAVVPTASTTNILTSALFNTSSLLQPPQHSLTLGVVEHAPDATLHEDFHIGQVMQYLNSCLAQGLSPGNKSQMNVSSLNTIQTKDSVYTNSDMAMSYCNQMRATGPVSPPFLKSATMTHATRETWRNSATNNQCKIANSRSKPDTSRVEMNGTLRGNGKTPSPVLFDSILVTPKVNKQISLDEAESKNGSVTMNDDDGNEGIVTGLGVVHTEKDLHGSPQVAWTEALTPVRDRGQTADDSDIDSDLENNNQLSAADYEQNGWSISAMAIFDNSCTNKCTESCVTESKERDKEVNAFVSNDNGLVKTNDKLAHRSMQNGMLGVCDDDDGETYKEGESEDVTNIKNTSDHMNMLDTEEQSSLIDHPDGNADKLIDQIGNQHKAGGAIEALRNGEQMSTETTMETRSPVILKIPKPKNIPQTDSANDRATSSISKHVKRIPKVRKQCNFPCCNGGMVKAKKLMKNYGSVQKKKLKRAFASSVKLKRCSVSLVRLPSQRKIHDVNANVSVNRVKQVDNDINGQNSVEFEEKRDNHTVDSKGSGHIKIKLKDIIAKVRHYKKTQRYKKRNPFLFYHKHKKHRPWKIKKIGTLCKDNIHVSPKCVTDTGRTDIGNKQPLTKDCNVMLDKLHIEDSQDIPENDESPKCTALDIESPKCIPLDIPYGFQFGDVFDLPCEDSTSDLDAYRSDLCSSNIQKNLLDDPSISVMLPYDSIEIRSIFKARPKKKKTWHIICEDPHPEDTIRVPRYHSRSHLKGIDPDGDPLEPTPQLVISHIAGSYLPHLASDSFLDHDLILKPKQQELCDEFCPLSEKQYMCSYCRHRYACIAHLEMHIKSHPRRRSPTQPMPHSLFGCCFCDIAFTNANLLRGHSRHTCGITVPKIASHISLLDMLNCTTRCVYQCSQCYESFPSLGVATGHLKHTCRALSGKHTTNESTQGDIITCFEGEGSSGKHLIRTYVYECAKCMLKFPNRKVLEGHVKHLCVYDWI